jgi:hypothetical protein
VRFDRELEVYQENLMELLADEGKYVVIRLEEILGPFTTYEEALESGYDRFGVTPFLVKKVHRPEAEPIHYFSRDLPKCTS